MNEAKEKPLSYRFALLAEKYIIKNLSLDLNPVIDSFHLLSEKCRSMHSKSKILQKLPIFRYFCKLTNKNKNIFKSVSPPFVSHSYPSQFATPKYECFQPASPSSISHSHMNLLFKDFISSFDKNSVEIYTDGSKSSPEHWVGVGVYIPHLKLKIAHRLNPDTSIFSAEA